MYDPYKGVLAYIKVINGQMKVGDTLNLVHSENIITPTEVGYFTPEYKADKIITGAVGFGNGQRGGGGHPSSLVVSETPGGR